jgi:hypothetical protein
MATFKQSFAAARKAGKREFTWNGKRYNTEMKETVRPKARGDTETGPKPRPKADMRPKPRSAPAAPAKKTGPTGAELKSSNDAVLAEQKAKREAKADRSKSAVQSAMAKAAGSRR